MAQARHRVTEGLVPDRFPRCERAGQRQATAEPQTRSKTIMGANLRGAEANPFTDLPLGPDAEILTPATLAWPPNYLSIWPFDSCLLENGIAATRIVMWNAM